MNSSNVKLMRMARRAHRVRAKIRGTTTVPRLSVVRSQKHIQAQIINDTASRTIAAASDLKMAKTQKPMERAKEVGKLIAVAAQKAGVTKVVFDRGSYRYHGRVAALADGAREGGLIF